MQRRDAQSQGCNRSLRYATDDARI